MYTRLLGNLFQSDVEQVSDIEDEVEIDIENTEKENVPFEDTVKHKPAVLSPEDNEIINKCTDSEIKHLMILNRNRCIQLKELYAKIYRILVECEKTIQEKQDSSVRHNKAIMGFGSRSVTKMNTWKIAWPYFKDREFFAAPPNADVISQKKNGEGSLLQLKQARRWTTDDQRTLKRAVMFSFYEYCVQDLEKEIRIFNLQIKTSEGEARIEKEHHMEKLKEQLRVMKQKDDYEPPPLYNDVGVDWLKISNVDLRGWCFYYSIDIVSNNYCMRTLLYGYSYIKCEINVWIRKKLNFETVNTC